MITADIQGLEPGEKVQLFELDASGIGGDYFRFHGYQTGEIWWQGKEYSAWPIQAEGFARTGEAQQPAPVLTLGNVDGSISALCVYFDDLVGAKLFRHTTLGKYLDAKNFPDGNPTADPNEAFPSELWYIEQKKAESNDVIQFELSSALDFNGRQTASQANCRQCLLVAFQWRVSRSLLRLYRRGLFRQKRQAGHRSEAGSVRRQADVLQMPFRRA